jgi:superfamily I DNA/RNA helicase
MAEARRLDPTQRAAAADAPVQLTLAGPGAGKTTTLAVRFVHLVRQGVDPRRILAVTFTRKAAIEMQDRIVRHPSPMRITRSRGSQVRNGLCAGGNWIRTSSSGKEQDGLSGERDFALPKPVKRATLVAQPPGIW